MISRNIQITAAPEGETYEALLKFARGRCSSFSLVWRYEMRLKPENDDVLAALAPYLISEGDTAQWPGTRIGGKARVRHYNFTRQVMPILFQVQSLYSWLHPKFPEDLALYMPNGDNWLASVAHERLAWITDAKLTVEQLNQAIPNLQVK